MKITGHHALVTGGGSGIGLAMARALLDAGNRVTIVGRNEARLHAARAGHANVEVVVADLSTTEGLRTVTEHVKSHARDLSLLVNNAGAMEIIDMGRPGSEARMFHETALNLVAPMHLSAALLPVLSAQPEAAIVNVSTALVYAPVARLPAYSASKAGLHAFTRALRLHLAGTRVAVMELVPPPVDTEMAAAVQAPKVAPAVVAQAFMEGLARDTPEVAVGTARAMRVVARIAPEVLFRRVNMAMNEALVMLPAGTP